MEETLNKGQETLEKGKHRVQEGVIKGTGDTATAKNLESQHKTQETLQAGAHRVEEKVHRTMDTIAQKLNPSQTNNPER